MKGKVGFGGALLLRQVHAQRPKRARSFRLPGGRLILTRDRGDSHLPALYMMSSLRLIHRDGDGVIKEVRDTGSGLVTNAGVNLMSYDFYWVSTYTKSALASANYHAIGTSATAASASDVWLNTAQGSTNLNGTTNGYMTGTQSIIANATSNPYSPVYQTVATFTATGSIAVTEWILAIGNGANIPSTAHTMSAVTSSSCSDTVNSPFTSSNGNAMWTVQNGGSSSTTTPVNTAAQANLQIKSNTTSVLTGVDGSWGSGTVTWLGGNNQAQSTPTTSDYYVVFPTAFDHKQFSTVNLASGDTLQTQYQLSINSGG